MTDAEMTDREMGTLIGDQQQQVLRGGFVNGVATTLSLGRTLAAYEVVITDDDGNRVCTSRITCLIRAQAPGG